MRFLDRAFAGQNWRCRRGRARSSIDRASVPETIAPLPLLRRPLKESNRCGGVFTLAPGSSTWASILFLFTPAEGLVVRRGCPSTLASRDARRPPARAAAGWTRSRVARALEWVAPVALEWRPGFARSEPRSATKSAVSFERARLSFRCTWRGGSALFRFPCSAVFAGSKPRPERKKRIQQRRARFTVENDASLGVF